MKFRSTFAFTSTSKWGDWTIPASAASMNTGSLWGFESLVSKVKPEGCVSVWVYGAENNRWIVWFVNPIRKHITSRMPPRLLLHLSKAPAALLYATTKLVYGPLNRSHAGRKIARHLFYNEYLNSISRFNWRATMSNRRSPGPKNFRKARRAGTR